MNNGSALKNISLRIIFYVNIICLLLLLTSNLACLLNPARWWLIALTGLVFPILLLLAIIFFIFWIFINKKKALISLLVILISFPTIKKCFAFNLSSDFIETKKKDNLRIITWNVGLMNYEIQDSATAAKSNLHIFNSLQQLNADVVCLQEFFTAIIPNSNFNLIDSISRQLNYPYHYFSYDRSQFEGAFYAGTIIFSKYKIVDSNKIVYPKPFPGSVIEAGLLVNNDTINITTTRLQSFHFEPDDYEALSDLKKGSADGMIDSKTIIEKLKYGYQQKLNQVTIVKQLINKSKRPIIFTGDLNDVPSSYAYSTIKNNMADAWLNKGFGIGRTFRFIAPTLRIDYIFYSDFFKAIQTRQIYTTASDHNGLVTDLEIKKLN
jgi:endonuclease/exonuclease/phosphatase (EEP) superfamily protein YafD